MCLAVPGRVIETSVGPADMKMGRVSFSGVVKEVCFACVPEADVGDWVIVHVGFAISRLDEEEAARALELFDEMNDQMNDQMTDETVAAEHGSDG